MSKFFIFSDFKPIAESLCRALRGFGYEAKEAGSESLLVEKLQTDEDAVVVIFSENDRKLRRLLWDVVRDKYLNPVIIAGSMPVDEFEDAHKEFDLTLYYAYFRIPFEIFADGPVESLLSRAGRMQPIEDDEVRRQICADYSQEPARMFGLLHDFKVLPSASEQAGIAGMIKILKRIHGFFEKHEDSRVISRLSRAIQDFEAGKWDKAQMSALKSYLETEIRKYEN